MLFDTKDDPGLANFASQGNHNLVVADVDGDGKDEILYGQMMVQDDGTGGHTTGRGHGDRMYATRMSADAKDEFVFVCLEHSHGANLRNARTGEELWYINTQRDCEPAICGDFDPDNPGFELWSSCTGWLKLDGTPHPLGKNHVSMSDKCVRWKGDLTMSLLGNRGVYHYNPGENKWDELFHWDMKAINRIPSAKAIPVFVGDFIGDWREEIIMRSADCKSLRVYVSPEPTEYKFKTFLENRQYRIGLALFNVGYNINAFPSFYFGPDLLKERN